MREACQRSRVNGSDAMDSQNVRTAICCCLSAVSGQWLETTIYLPDSFGGLTQPQCLVYDSLNNFVYVGGAECVMAIDGATNRRVARIPTGLGTRALCVSPENKVYCASNDSVTVIDVSL